MDILLTAAIAILGGFIFYRMKIPAGAMIGAIIFTASFNLFTEMGAFPQECKFIVQAIAGGFIGQRITKNDLYELRGIFGAGILVFLWMAGYTLLVGGIMSLVTELDLATALVSAMPAGLSDIAIISTDVGADPVQSTVMQMARMLFSVIALPQLGFKICERSKCAPTDCEPEKLPGYKPPEVKTPKNAAMTISLSLISGVLGKISGVPAGAMVASVFTVAALNVKTERGYLPKKLRLFAQCIAGAIIGAQITMSDIKNMRGLMLPIAILVVSLVFCNYVCAWILHRVCKIDIPTSIFASIPAGMSDMALISTDMGGDAPKTAVLHLVRYVGILSIMPSVIKFIC